MSTIFVPYNLALDLDYHFQETTKTGFDSHQFHQLVATLKATGSVKNQEAALACFKKHTIDEVIRRIDIVSRQDKLLETIQSNRINR